jgi:tetratricopeptide (TPR) repeat protein
MRALSLALAIASSVAAPALAQPAENVDESHDLEARALYDAGTVAYSEGRYENALEYLTRAYALSARPLLLYNIAVITEHLRRDEEALDYYRRYLAEVPDAENRRSVEARIAILERAIAEQRAQARVNAPVPYDHAHPPMPIQGPQPIGPPIPYTMGPPLPWMTVPGPVQPVDTLPVDPRPQRSGNVGPGGGIALTIVGGLVLVVGVVLAAIAGADQASLANIEDGTRWEDIEDAYHRMEPLSIAGGVLIPLGAAITAGGVAWIAVSTSGSSERPPSARLTIGGSF